MVADVKAIVICSAPIDTSFFGSCLDYSSRITGMQALLGYEAQIRAFAKVVSRASIRCLITAAPEIFYTKPSFAPIEDAIGAQGGRIADVVHVRFGPPRQSRILRGVANVYVCSETASDTQAFESRNPYAANTLLPANFTRVVSWCSKSTPSNIAGRPMAVHALPSEFATADIEPARDAAGIAEIYVRKSSSLLVQSFFEFNADAWRPSAGSDHRASTEFSRLLVAWGRAIGNRNAPRPLIMLPWNLANPASVVPDVVTKIAGFDLLRHVDQSLLIYPYNFDTNNQRLIVDLVGKIKHLSGGQRSVLDKLFLARASGDYGIEVMREIVQIALLEASDTEWRWTNQRLAGLGIGTALLAEPSYGADHDISIAVDADQALQMRVHDEFGERYYRTFSPAPIALAEFLRVACSRSPWRASARATVEAGPAVASLVNFIAGSWP